MAIHAAGEMEEMKLDTYFGRAYNREFQLR